MGNGREGGKSKERGATVLKAGFSCDRLRGTFPWCDRRRSRNAGKKQREREKLCVD